MCSACAGWSLGTRWPASRTLRNVKPWLVLVTPASVSFTIHGTSTAGQPGQQNIQNNQIKNTLLHVYCMVCTSSKTGIAGHNHVTLLLYICFFTTTTSSICLCFCVLKFFIFKSQNCVTTDSHTGIERRPVHPVHGQCPRLENQAWIQN